MAHFKRHRPKAGRGGCLMCKPHKVSGKKRVGDVRRFPAEDKPVSEARAHGRGEERRKGRYAIFVRWRGSLRWKVAEGWHVFRCYATLKAAESAFAQLRSNHIGTYCDMRLMEREDG